jgi:hypothetical protein
MKGHMDDLSKLEFKQGDGLKRAVKAQTNRQAAPPRLQRQRCSRCRDQLPGGRGHGEPVRLMVELEENHDFVEIFVHEPGRKLLVAATSGHGFIVPEDEMVAMTRKGKQVMNVDEPAEACTCVPAEVDMVATIGENRKMLIFPADEVPEMGAAKACAAALQGRGRATCACSKSRRARLARSGGPHLHAADVRAQGLGRQRAQASRLRPGPQIQQFGPSSGSGPERQRALLPTCARLASGRWVPGLGRGEPRKMRRLHAASGAADRLVRGACGVGPGPGSRPISKPWSTRPPVPSRLAQQNTPPFSQRASSRPSGHGATISS